MLTFYLRSAWRNILRKGVLSALYVVGLSVGIGVFLLALEYYSYETGFNRFHQHLPSLYRVDIAGANGAISPSTMPSLAPLMQQDIPGVRAAVRVADNFNSGAVVSWQPSKGDGQIKSFAEEGCVFVDPAFLNAFSFAFVEGNNQLAKTNTVVITQSVAHKFFGGAPAVGKVLQLHNQFGALPVEVVGVIADIPAQSDIRFDYLFSIHILDNAGYTQGQGWARLDNWGNDSYTTYVWLSSGADPVSVSRTASRLWAQGDPDYKTSDGTAVLQPVSELHLGSTLSDRNPTAGSRLLTYFIMSLGLLILCIAWINYINFSTAYALKQAKEIGIHKIIGSRKRQIVYRYVAESFLMNAVGLLLAICLVNLAQGLFNYLSGKSLSLQYVNHPGPWLGIAVVLVTGVLLCGGYVGWLLARYKPVSILRFNDHGKGGALLLRRALVVFQFVISILFIAGTIVANRQIRFMKHHSLGMEISGLTMINGPVVKDSSFRDHSVAFRNEVENLSFVTKFSATGSVPGVGFAHNFEADGITGAVPQTDGVKRNYSISIVDDRYFDIYEIPLVSGRDFTGAEVEKGFKGDRLMLNETACRDMGYDPSTAAGRVVHWDKDYVIVGVVRDYHHRSLKEEIEPIVFVPQRSNAHYTLSMTADGRTPEHMEQIKTLYEHYYPGNPFSYALMTDAYNAQYSDEQRAGVIALSIGVLVVLIAGLGLAGLSIFAVKRRDKEIGIRKVLGAGAGSLFLLLSGEFLWLVLIAFCIAAPIAWMVMSRWLERFETRIDLTVGLFALSGALAMLLALATISVQVLKATFADPVKSLRSE